MKTAFVLSIALLTGAIFGSLPAQADEAESELLGKATAHAICAYTFRLRMDGTTDPVIALQYSRAMVGATAIAADYLYQFAEEVDSLPKNGDEAYAAGYALSNRAISTYNSWDDKDRAAMNSACMDKVSDYIDVSFKAEEKEGI